MHRCPCGKCEIVTPIGACLTCDPKRAAKFGKTQGIKVCLDYLDQMGL